MEKRIRKGIYLIPSGLTVLSIICGFYSIVLTIKLEFIKAGVMIILATVLDALDGRVARLTGTTSEFGVELDSLADVVSFGIAPGVLLYYKWFSNFEKIGWIIGALFVVCGALRLARFNSYDLNESITHFNGLAIPAGANTVVAFIFIQEFYLKGLISDKIFSAWMIPFCILVSFLMVSHIKYPAYKNLKLKKGHPFRVLVIFIMIIFILLILKDKIYIFAAFTYTFGTLIYNLITSKTRRKKNGTDNN